MFWKKLILINIVICYLALKIFLLISSKLNKNREKLENISRDAANSSSPDNLLIGEYMIDNNKIECDIKRIIEYNEKLIDKFDLLRNTLFFKIFKVNFDSPCNFWTQNMICNFHTCAVCQCEENEVPLPWMQDSENDNVDKSIEEKFHRWVEKYNYSSPNWIVENEIDSRNGIFVNLQKNPEAYTGYQGQHIWNAIYYENCFKSQSPDQMCREDKAFYKIISGLHSNINIHLSRNYIDIQKNISSYNTTMLNERLLSHPDRMNNLFFLYSLLMKALYKSENIIKSYDFFTGDKAEDTLTNNLIDEIFTYKNTSVSESCLNNQKFNFDDKFMNFDFNPVKLDELKMRFRNISEIIDCVSCQKCKLHGKLQIYGLATMLKILFSPGDKEVKLKRNELISFVNLVGKVGRAIQYLNEIPQTHTQDQVEGEIKIQNTQNDNLVIKTDQPLDIFLFLIYLIPVSLILLLLNRYFINNKHLMENPNKLLNAKKAKMANQMKNQLLNEDNLLKKLKEIGKDDDFVLTKGEKKNQ